MSLYFLVIILTLVVSILHDGHTARILGVFPTPSISHQVVFRALTLALNDRGHELVVVTTDPVNDPTRQNYTEIDIGFLYDEFDFGSAIYFRGKSRWLGAFKYFINLIDLECNKILGHPELRKLYVPGSGEKFDLILIEMFWRPVFLALGKRFDAPVVGMTSLSVPLCVHYELGNSIYPSHPSNWEFGAELPESWTFWSRLDIFIRNWRYIHFYRSVFIPEQEAIARRFFGDDSPALSEAERNVSLIFVNQQEPISYARPSVPKVIGIGGVHISKYVQPLPENFQKILDGATQGFVYMSLGSNVKSNQLCTEHKVEFIAAFAKLPYKVIWKYENDTLPGKPDNVEIMKWTPQQAILAHPNLKVFIYQGGLQSTEEAISHGVPLIGLPVMGDQDTQVDKMVSLGVAKKLEITSINRNDLLEAIFTIIDDSSYKQRMLNLRSVLEDRPYDPLKNAIWWTEYVIRHRGAPQLHSTTADEPWYERQDMDIIAFISAGLTIVMILTFVISYQCLVCIVNFFQDRSIGKK